MTSPLNPSAWPTREEVARIIHADLNPHRSWDEFEARRQEWRNGALHETQEQAFSTADAILALFPPFPAREAEEAGGWLPIESAPKDGTIIDVWRTEGGRDTVFWGYPDHTCGEAGQYCDSDWHSIRAPGWVCNTFGELLGRNHAPFTHWQPLPAPPHQNTLDRGEK